MSHATGGASPDAKHQAATARQVALLGGVFLILSGLIALGSGYWNAYIAAKASEEAASLAARTSKETAELAAQSALKTVDVQITGETEKSRAEFLRGQRQVLYAKLLTGEVNMIVAENTYFRQTQRSKKDIRRNYTKYQEAFAQARSDYVEGTFGVYIIGSKEVRDTIDELEEKHNSQKNSLNSLLAEKSSTFPTRGAAKRYEDEFDKDSSDIGRLLDQFLKHARDDMGVR